MRPYTCKLLEVMDERNVDQELLVEMLARWFSESEIKEFFKYYFSEECEEDE